MKLNINGEKLEVLDSVENIRSLLQHFGLENKVVIVEQNAVILQKEEHDDARLSDGDRIEIVHFVGGG
ncbi:sulfur carrier protein ThiS [Heyndrickxia acidicola]|uniref:Sulfur carrier protein ThiS n=1 Tax=Heyndrickxia acidicola TaxID=209389 RepID=A0ABU6MGQ4_9BACI|nr:sulfur carrier protein ThiS [Heyndrickxia acidicola]MED1203572.1 sulfur carrier protein ThiS [Heyndrickxia acidicola]